MVLEYIKFENNIDALYILIVKLVQVKTGAWHNEPILTWHNEPIL